LLGLEQATPITIKTIIKNDIKTTLILFNLTPPQIYVLTNNL